MKNISLYRLKRRDQFDKRTVWGTYDQWPLIRYVSTCKRRHHTKSVVHFSTKKAKCVWCPKWKKKYKIHTIRKDIKNLKYVKTIKMYKILTEIDLNYKFKKITFKILRITNWLIAWLRESKSLMACNSFKLQI